MPVRQVATEAERGHRSNKVLPRGTMWCISSSLRCKYEVAPVWRVFVYIAGRRQWNDREDDKSMMITVSYARYMRVPAGSMAGLLHRQQP